ncbi:LEAF RUST 10 DISEASE-RESISTANCEUS RECEPTOR-LIKE PROTEIN KINASE-like 1.2 [Rutidosis leptorrhynchoides]|uniref:LEAF RUST 10 DISEASE-RESISTANCEUS RECEPTOR-LIKE PROTEIN KINASE-like 1.2 n=1 Tax=Rutidosis leptorrhynchoides TaxID=125765 RepID=UPI003A9A2711
MNPHTSILLIAIAFHLIIVIRCQETVPYNDCQPLQCGTVTIDYPFWGSTRPNYCGYDLPDFQITCQSNVTELTFDSVDYRVLDTDSTTQTITVARNDLWVNNCPRLLYNTTYNSSFYNGDNFNQQNVSIYYNCSTTIPVVQQTVGSFQCNVNGTQIDNYFGRTSSTVSGGWLEYVVRCENHIDVPVNQTWADQFAVAGTATEEELRSALMAGFKLEWTANNDECNQCVKSGGRCGSNSTSPELFACYCANGNFSLTCNNTKNRSGGGSKSSSSLPIVLAIVGAVIAGVGIVLAIFVCRRRRKRRAIKEASPAQTETKAILTKVSSKGLTSDNSDFTSSIPSYPSSKTSKDFTKSSYFGAQIFTYEELLVATDNFNESRVLGDGGFGAVYYGKLLDGQEVAVKRLYENNFKRVEQFMNEVEILSKMEHENLVKLYGCTSKRSRELVLVYEYISNGTVADHLHGKLSNTSSSLFSWPVRLNIAIETADALAHLHKSDIIHRDVKTNNILLDKSFRVKVADFGLSRLFPNDATHVSTAPQGTPGYVDPEYYQCYQLTDKSDVYSFGVVLIELISSLQAVDTNRHRLDINLANMAMTKIQNHQLDELVDKSIGFETNSSVRRMVTLVAELAFRCLQQQKEMRPSMNEVLEALRGIQNDQLNVQKPEVLDIVVDDGGLLKDHNTEPSSPNFGITNKLVESSVTNSSDGV